MNRVLEQIFSVVADLVKLFAFAGFVVFILTYGVLNIVAYRAMSLAEEKGRFQDDDIRMCLNFFRTDVSRPGVIDESKLTVETDPYLGSSAGWLGEPMTIRLEYKMEIPLLKDKIPMELVVEKSGVNQHYETMSDYGSYELEGAGP